MLERSTASSSAKSNRASRPLAPASGRKPRAGNSAGGDGGGGSLPRAASPASGVDLSRTSTSKRPQRQHRQQGLRGVLQGGEETGASPLVDGADLSPPGAYLGSSSGAPQSSTGKGSSSSGSNNSSGNDLDGRGSPAAEEGETVPAVRLFGASAPSPPVAPSPSIVLLGPPPPEEAGAASSRRGTVAGAREGGAGALVDGAGLRNAARGLDDDDDADVDGAGEEVEEDMETEVQGGGMAAGLADGEVCPGKNDSITAEEESETDTVKKWVSFVFRVLVPEQSFRHLTNFGTTSRHKKITLSSSHGCTALTRHCFWAAVLSPKLRNPPETEVGRLRRIPAWLWAFGTWSRLSCSRSHRGAKPWAQPFLCCYRSDCGLLNLPHPCSLCPRPCEQEHRRWQLDQWRRNPWRFGGDVCQLGWTA